MKQKGITLIELMVVMAIMAIFSLGAYNYSNAQFNIYKIQSAQTQLQYDAKNAANQIASDIKRSRFTSESVKTNFSESDFSELNKLIYTPIVYIEQLGDKNCIYVLKKITSENVQIVKFDCNSESDTISINLSTEKVIANNVDEELDGGIEVASVDSTNNSAYNINVNLEKTIIVNGKTKPISRNFIICASRELYD